jgi:hypothetical protein
MFLPRVAIFTIFIIISWFALSALYSYLDPNTEKSEEDLEEALWIATSAYRLDRLACRWVGLCGLAHYRPEPAWQQRRRRNQQAVLTHTAANAEHAGWGEAPPSGTLRPGDFDGDERVLKDVPQFVLDHAPLVHLYSGEQFWPSDMAEHLTHTVPYVNHTSLNSSTQYGLHNLEDLHSEAAGRYLFMKSLEDVEDRPVWLGSAYNKPIPYPDEGEDPDEEVDTYTEFAEATAAEREPWFDPYGPKLATPLPASSQAHQKTRKHRSLTKRSKPSGKPDPSGRSSAPAVLILIDKGNNTLDAFWFYFYSYNLGTTVLNIRFGNHVGDWEHSLIRFHKGVPKAVFFSAHSGGTAYTYDAVEKGRGKGKEGRPVLYSALGSHAMYAMPGKQPYVLPFGLLGDVTDKGPLWDPALNYYAYHLNTSLTNNAGSKVFSPNPNVDLRSSQSFRSLQVHQSKDAFVPASRNPDAPTSWFWFKGHWGDKYYQLSDERQWRFAMQYHYVNGPFGPRYKNLGRSMVCQSGKTCRMLESIEEGKKSSWISSRSLLPEEGLVDVDPDLELVVPIRNIEIDG